MKSNLKVVLMVAAIGAGAAGCAHGASGLDRRSDVRGGARVGSTPRALLVGPARLVHATGDKQVRWFVAEQVTGDDRDCAKAAASPAPSESSRAHLSVSSGQVLCAAVAAGATDVNWHRMPETDDGLWALR